jgi:hypothetical protein
MSGALQSAEPGGVVSPGSPVIRLAIGPGIRREIRSLAGGQAQQKDNQNPNSSHAQRVHNLARLSLELFAFTYEQR